MATNTLVIIGDIVDSRSINKRADRFQFQKQLKQQLDNLNKDRSDIVLPYKITLGDEFHVVYTRADNAMLDVLSIAQSITPFKTRFSFGVGGINIEEQIHNRKKVGVDAEIYQKTRKKIKELKAQDRLLGITGSELNDSIKKDIDSQFASLEPVFKRAEANELHRVRQYYSGRGNSEASTVKDGSVCTKNKTKNREYKETTQAIGQTTNLLNQALTI